MEIQKAFKPNFTPIPNVILDRLMADLTDGEFRCLLYICRRTYGFQKGKDRIALGQFVNGVISKDNVQLDHGAGISRRSAINSLQKLAEYGLIKVNYTTKGNIYEINLDIDTDIEQVVQNLHRCKINTKSSATVAPKQVQLFHPQKKEKESNKIKPIANKSLHKEFINYFFDLAKKTRGVNCKVVIGGKGGLNLKRVIDAGLFNKPDMEKLALYYLASGDFKSFSPDLSVMLSGGVLNVLLNKMRNDPNFYKNLDAYTQYHFKQPTTEGQARSVLDQLAKLKTKFAMA